ncbi:MAG TPA: hypothetical protein VN643_27235 [Pyrinomonadaceae bacterium]|nr:hypothetical protein [Pyrinomonadaceae bacterium]
MFIEQDPKERHRSGVAMIFLLFGQYIALVRSAGTAFIGLAINTWPLCGQDE